MDPRARAPNTNGVSNEHLTKILCHFPDSEECDRLVATACGEYFDCQESLAGTNTRCRTATGSKFMGGSNFRERSSLLRVMVVAVVAVALFVISGLLSPRVC